MIKKIKYSLFVLCLLIMNESIGQFLNTDGSNNMTGALKVRRTSTYANVELESNVGAYIDFKSNINNDFDGRIIWNLNNSDRFDIYGITNFKDRVTFNGNVGIGTGSVPSERLHVEGKIRIPVATANNNQSPGIVAISNDDVLYDGQYINNYGIGFHNFQEGSGFNGINAYLSGFYGVDIFTAGQNRVRISSLGNLLIGKTEQINNSYKLDVAGKVRANEIVVNTTGADYVFESDYELADLNTVEEFIKENNHLPGIPSAAEMQKEGMSVGELNTKLLEKVEELTLYMIEMKKENESLKKQNNSIIIEIQKLKKSK